MVELGGGSGLGVGINKPEDGAAGKWHRTCADIVAFSDYENVQNKLYSSLALLQSLSPFWIELK